MSLVFYFKNNIFYNITYKDITLKCMTKYFFKIIINYCDISVTRQCLTANATDVGLVTTAVKNYFHFTTLVDNASRFLVASLLKIKNILQIKTKKCETKKT